MSHDLENEFADLAQALREARPVPEPDFTERLDQAVADHFPPEWADEAALGKQGRGGIGSLAERFRRRLNGRRVLLPAMAGLAGILLVATVVVGAVDSGRFGLGSGDDGGTTIVDKEPAGQSAGVQASNEDTATPESFQLNGGESTARLGDALRKLAPMSSDSSAAPDVTDVLKPTSKGLVRNRDVAREAEITLGTSSEDVQDVANKVVEVTDDHNGIVMDSKVTDGKEGTAGASFSLLIPSGQIEATVADLSSIADLRSRSQELTDITAPTNKTEDKVADSKARIESLLGELEETYDETERTEIERKIRWERNDLRYYESRLNRLQRRADYTPISLEVETGGEASDDDSSWGLGDAVDDAGKLLGVAAGVTVLALAVAIPIGIVVLIALALNRAWVRRSRRRILEGD